jgi:hypothetical protein
MAIPDILLAIALMAVIRPSGSNVVAAPPQAALTSRNRAINAA